MADFWRSSQALHHIDSLTLGLENLDSRMLRRLAGADFVLKEMERQGAITTLDSLRRERQQLQARAANLMRSIELGGDIPRLVQRFREVEDEIAQLDRAIASHRVVKPKVTAEQVRNRVVKTLMRLRDMLDEQEVAVARAALRKHVGRLTLTPTVKEGRRVFEVSGNFSPTGDQPDGAMRLVARDGIEPPTPAFSGLLTDNDKPCVFNKSY